MSRNQRFVLLALAAVVAVAAVLLVGGGDDDDDSADTQGAPAAQTEPGTPTATAPSAPEPPPAAERISLRGHVPVGGVKEIKAVKGDPVRIVVASPEKDEIHLHGYDITRTAAAGTPARFRFTADIEGVFEIESHEAEHAGEDPVIARLVVEPE